MPPETKAEGSEIDCSRSTDDSEIDCSRSTDDSEIDCGRSAGYSEIDCGRSAGDSEIDCSRSYGNARTTTATLLMANSGVTPLIQQYPKKTRRYWPHVTRRSRAESRATGFPRTPRPSGGRDARLEEGGPARSPQTRSPSTPRS